VIQPFTKILQHLFPASIGGNTQSSPERHFDFFCPVSSWDPQVDFRFGSSYHRWEKTLEPGSQVSATIFWNMMLVTCSGAFKPNFSRKKVFSATRFDIWES